MVYIYYILLVRATLLGVGWQGGCSSHLYPAKIGTFGFWPLFFIFTKVYLNTLAFWNNLEDSTTILRVPLSIFDILRVPEKAPTFWNIFFCSYDVFQRGFDVWFCCLLSRVRSGRLLEESVLENTFEDDCLQRHQRGFRSFWWIFPVVPAWAVLIILFRLIHKSCRRSPLLSTGCSFTPLFYRRSLVLGGSTKFSEGPLLSRERFPWKSSPSLLFLLSL